MIVFQIPFDDKPGAPETSSDIFRRCRDVPSAKRPNQLIRLRGRVWPDFAGRLLHEAE
jgi:hypothetical protein